MANTIRVIASDHDEIHEGESYSAVHQATVAAAGTLDLQITTPANGFIHLVLEASATGEALVALYEAPTTSAGTPVTSRNRSRVSSNATAAAVVHTPSVSAVGSVLLETCSIGAGKGAGGLSRSMSEWILKQGTKYLMRVTSNANGNIVTAGLLWYEVGAADED